MPLTTAIMHPRMTVMLGTAFYNSLCTIYTTDLTDEPSSYGEPNASPQVLTDHQDIPCSFHAMPTKARLEQRNAERTVAQDFNTCYLQGHYPAITPRMTAVVDGITYNIQSARSPSQRSHTQLELELVRP